MSISDTSENALLLLIFQATTWANYAINATASPETSIAVALHTADPGEAGTMATSEIGYTSYLRLTGGTGIARTSGGWTVSTNSVTPVANIDFAASTGGTPLATFFSTGKSGGGASAVLFSGTVTPSISCTTGVTPRLTTATLITMD